MTGNRYQESLPLLEFAPVQPVFVTKLAKIEWLPGDNIQFTFAVERQHGGETILDVQTKLVGPKDEAMDAVSMILAFLAEPHPALKRVVNMLC
jgi:hypothetical protein